MKLLYTDPSTQQNREISTAVSFSGAGAAGRPVVLDGTGKIAAGLIPDGVGGGGGGPATYDRRVDSTNPDSIYVGDAAPGSLESDPVWRIFRADFSANSATKNYADSTDTFDKVWNDRATYTY